MTSPDPVVDRATKLLKDFSEMERTIVRGEYLDDSGRCPFCKSERIEGVGKTNMDVNEYSSLIRCYACDKEWWDIYKLSRIEVEAWDV